MKHPTRPCKECPISRHGAPGGTGGAAVTTFIGQLHAPMFLPCHMAPGYWDNPQNPDAPQCAGAAIYRATTGALARFPDHMKRGLHVLPPDPEGATGAFRSPVELLEFHKPSVAALPGCAAFLLSGCPPELLADAEMEKVLSGREGRVVVKPNEGS